VSASTTAVTMPAHVRADDLSALVWATAFDTGDAKVDCEQHELLVDINELSRCQADASGRRLSGSANCCATSASRIFRDERSVLQSSKYGKLAAHERQQRYIEQQLDDVLACIGGVTRPSRAEVEAVLFLRSMLSIISSATILLTNRTCSACGAEVRGRDRARLADRWNVELRTASAPEGCLCAPRCLGFDPIRPEPRSSERLTRRSFVLAGNDSF